MAARMIFVLASFLNIFTSQVQAQNTTTAIPSPTPALTMIVGATSAGLMTTAIMTATQQIKPTPTTTSAPSSTVSSGFETILKATATYKGECKNSTDDKLKTGIQSLFSGSSYDLQKPIHLTTEKSGEKCMVNFTLTFGKGLSESDIIGKFENASKSGIGGVTLEDVTTEVSVDEVTVGEYKADNENCKAKCCGTGGPITVERNCSHPLKCKNYRLKKEVKDCNTVCKVKDLCGGGMSLHVSLLMLVFGGLLNWVLKQ